MRLIFPSTIDARREIKLSGKIPTERQEVWKADIDSTFELFNGFVTGGGLSRVIEPIPRKPAGKLDWEREIFIYTWLVFPFEPIGLGIIFRMLSCLRHDGAGLDAISIHGTPIVPDQAAVIKETDVIAERLPDRMPSLPFELEICPSSAWITIECDLSPSFPPDIAPALHEAILTWGKVANAGGFQINSEIEGPTYDQFSVGLDGPTVADNFLEWNCLMTGVPAGSLSCLVNVLGHFSRQIYPIAAVYIG